MHTFTVDCTTMLMCSNTNFSGKFMGTCYTDVMRSLPRDTKNTQKIRFFYYKDRDFLIQLLLKKQPTLTKPLLTAKFDYFSHQTKNLLRVSSLLLRGQGEYPKPRLLLVLSGSQLIANQQCTVQNNFHLFPSLSLLDLQDSLEETAGKLLHLAWF